MHIEGLKNQQIKKGELNNSPTFGAKPVTSTIGRQVTDKAMKVLGAASAAIIAAGIALSKKEKDVDKLEQVDYTKLVSNIATDDDLREIHKIDLEAFSENYGVYSDFREYKKDLEEQDVTTYVIKSQNGDILGYYQLEPVEDGELYVHSMAIKKDLRVTRASVAVLNLIKDEILNVAIEKNADKVVLDVESENKPLIRLYEKFGFKITDSVDVLTPQGMRKDHYMEIDVKKYLAEQAEKEKSKEQTVIDYSEISNEQVEEIANQIRQNPIFKEKMSETRINRYTIPLILKVLNCKDNLKPFLINSSIGRVISHTALTGETSSAKAILLDRILGDEKYEKLPVNLFDYLLANVNYSYQIGLLDKILEKSEINQNENYLYNMSYMLARINHEKQYELAYRIIEDEKLSSNEMIMSNLQDITHCVKKDTDIDTVIEFLNNKKIISDPQRFRTFLAMFIAANNKEKTDFVRKIITDDNLYNYDYLKKQGAYLVSSYAGEKSIKAKEKFIEEYLSDEKLYGNEILKSHFLFFLAEINNIDQVYAKMNLIKEIFSNEKLYSNKNLMDNLRSIVLNTDKIYDSVPKTEMIKKIFSDERIVNNPSVVKNLGKIIERTSTEKKLRANYVLIDNVLSDEKILNNPTLEKCLGSMLAADDSNVYSTGQIKTLLRLFEAAFEKKNVLKVAGEDISDDEICQIFGYCFPAILRAVETIGEANFIHCYNMKLRGSVEYARSIWNLKNYSSYDKLLSKINPEMTSKYISLSQDIAKLKKKYPEVKASSDTEKLKELQNEIATLAKRMQEIRKSKVKLDPQQVINKTRVLAAIADNNPFALQEFVDLIQDGTKENEAIWKEKVNRYIFDVYEIEYDEKISERLNLISSKYIGEILSANDGFKKGFKKIIGLIKANPTKSNEEIFDMLPQNIKTKEMFNALGIDYEKWSKFDESSSVKIQVELSVDEARKAAVEALEKEFNHAAFYSLPTAEVNKIFQALRKVGLKILSVEAPVWSANETVLQTQTVMKLFKDDAPIKFDDLSLIMKTIKKAMNENDFWTKSTGNPEIDSYKDTVYTHLTKDRDQQYHTAKGLKEDTVVELEIRKTDMNNISHALFLGNHGACCTAVGTGCNQYSAPTYVMNKLVSAIEIVDNGNFVGNTMCYIALVDGVPSLVLDNIELKADYHNNDKIRDALMEYAKKLCAEIGKPDMPIYAGPYRHKLRMEDYEFRNHDMQIVGSSGDDELYLDFITAGREITGNEVDTVKLFKIR